MTEFERTTSEIVKFMRGRYQLDEEAGMVCGIPCVKFCQDGKTIVSVNLREGCYEFQIIFGKTEREKFEAARNDFPSNIQKLYDETETLYDNKCLFVRVDAADDFENVKKLIHIKKEPNRKPLPKADAVFGKCGHRCDLCVHYTQISEKFRRSLIPHLNAVYGGADWGMRCTGCDTAGCHCYTEDDDICEPLKCLPEKKLNHCFDCKCYPCEHTTVGYCDLEHRSLSAANVTWASLPYVPHQYER